MVKTFWTTLTRRRLPGWPRRRLVLITAALIPFLVSLACASQAQAFPILGGFLRGFGGLLGRLGLGGLLLLGGSVHDQAREDLQIAIHAKEQVKLAYKDETLEELGKVRGNVAVWDSIRIAWLGEYERQMTKAPPFAYEPAPEEQSRFEAALAGRDRELLGFMDDPRRTRDLWTGVDPHFGATQGDPQPYLEGATEAALGAQTGIVALLGAGHQALGTDAGELARYAARIDSLGYVMQMRDASAQGLLLQIKQLQQLRYGLLLETARRASAYGEKLNAEARRRALYERLLVPAAESD